MSNRTLVTVAAMSLLCACSSLEGVFEPACIAYEGDKIQLADGRFEWHKFTDQVSVDRHGNVVEAFPGYPKYGRYEQSDARIRLLADDDSQPDDFYLFDDRGRKYLLTWEQNEAVLNGEGLPTCALRLADDAAR